MRMIVSAYNSERSPIANTSATAALLNYLSSDYTTQLCVGTFNEGREISVIVRGIDTTDEAIDLASTICAEFDQSCCLILHDDGTSWFYPATYTGGVYVASTVDTPPDGDCTDLLDGTYLVLTKPEPVKVH